MDEMLALLGSHKPCMLFESIFLKCMPEDICLQLATASFDDLRTLAQTADELWQVREQPVVVFSSDTRRPRNTRTTPVATPRANESVTHDEDVCYYHRQRGQKVQHPVCICGKRPSQSSLVASPAGQLNSLLFLVDG